MPHGLCIQHPSRLHDNERLALPYPFTAIGKVPVVVPDPANASHTLKVKFVIAKVQLFDAFGTLSQSLVQLTPILTLSSCNHPGYLRWTCRICLKDPTDRSNPECKDYGLTRAKLTVEGHSKDMKCIASDEVDFWIRPKRFSEIPFIDYPDTDGYVISGSERDTFLCAGTSDLPITNLTLDGVQGYFEWSDIDGTWWGSFSPGSTPGTGTHFAIVASNADGSSVARYVDVASS